MIANVAPPFGFVTAASLLLSRKPAPAVGETEENVARMLGVRSVVLLPSVRSGIYMVLKAVSGPQGLVVGPAYTCGVVHQAMRASGLRIRFIDAAPRQFSMACDQLSSAMEPGCCVIFCEMYGIPTSPNMIKASGELRPAVRILDMAVGIPDPGRLSRMESTDVAMFSFGSGKCMHAGWGGLACFQEEGLARRIREMRDGWATQGTALHHQSSALGVLARIAKRSRAVYGLATTASAVLSFLGTKLLGMDERPRSSRPVDVIKEFNAEWTRLPGPFSRKLTVYNFRRWETAAEIRRRLAETYIACLRGSDVVQGVAMEALPQSNFPIRVSADIRTRVQDYLWNRGIGTARQVPLPESLDPSQYPHAAQASEEVLTLPFGEHVSTEDAKRISGHALEALRREDRGTPPHE